MIESEGGDDVGEHEQKLNEYAARLQFVRESTIPNIWHNAAAGVPAYMFTLHGLRNALSPVLTREGHKQSAAKLQKFKRHIGILEARLVELEPRAASLGDMVSRIEGAYEAADQLPADLTSLSDAREKVADLLKQAQTENGRISQIGTDLNPLKDSIKKSENDAKDVLILCETAYSAATSVGLAAAFDTRSKSLFKAMKAWVAGLIVALAVGSWFGSTRLLSLAESFKDPSQPPSVIVLQVILSLLSIGAPIWFAWLSTKQINQQFRLGEDYAFKASVASAYEGFRREAARIDKDMEAKLLQSALTRLDELPLRLVQNEPHGSPFHELANSDLIKEAFRLVPNFASQLSAFAETLVDKARKSSRRDSAAENNATKAE